MKSKKKAIFEAVLELVNENGVNSSIKIADIAQKAGIGKGTVYEYFKSKDEILVESLKYLMQDISDRILLDDKIEGLCFKEDLIYHIRKILEIMKENNCVYALFFSYNIGSMADNNLKMEIFQQVQFMKMKYLEGFSAIIDKGLVEDILSKKIQPFNMMAANNLLFSEIIQFSNKGSFSEEMTEEEFINKLYDLVVKILE
ncbi:TetR/AcrR family transcriptional regulator [Clostridium sp. DL1XJH146]